MLASRSYRNKAFHIDESGRIINLDVTLNITHTYIGDLKVVLFLPSRDELILYNRNGYIRHDIKKTYSTKTEGSMQFVIGKEIKGD